MRLFRIRPDKLEIFLEWGKKLQNNPEAISSIKEEQVEFEGFYYFKFDKDYYTFGITDNPNPLPASDRELNRQHRAILKECLEPVTQIDTVYTLKAK